MRATISRAEVMAFARSLGADPLQTKYIEVFPDRVEVTAFLVKDGGRYVDEATGEPAEETTVIKVVGDMRRDTVAMRHPNLPGRVIHVRPRVVGQRAMAGWEVVPPYDNGGELPSGVSEVTSAEPIPITPPPESGSKPEAPAETGASSSPPPRGRRTTKKKEDG